VEGKAKPWNDASVKDWALEGRYEVNGVACKPGFELFREIRGLHAGEDVRTHHGAGCDHPPHRARDGARRADRLDDRNRRQDAAAAAGGLYLLPRGIGAQVFHGDGAFLQDGQSAARNIDAPGGHVGVTLDDKMETWATSRPGANGMIDRSRTRSGRRRRSRIRRTSPISRLFSVRLDTRASESRGADEPGEVRPRNQADTVLLCHANPL